jgi:hypothetical protein
MSDLRRQSRPLAAALLLLPALLRCGSGGGGFTARLDSGTGGAMTVTVRNQSGRAAYVKFTGSPVTVSPNNTAVASGASADFALTAAEAGRLYISLDRALQSDAPDGANPADPDYRTRFDKVELTYDQGGKANLTAVDFYGLPLVLETSVQGLTVEHLTLAAGQTGQTLAAALTAAAADPNAATVRNAAGTEVVRILSPVKCPAAYARFDSYLAGLDGATLDLTGTYYGSPSQTYAYTGAIASDAITLAGAGHTLRVPMASLQYDAADTVGHNGIYTCNGAYTVDGSTRHVADNDLYAAVYRDLVAGFNLGFVRTGANDSSTWWSSTPFQGTCNPYAKAVAAAYPGAYEFPFTDRYRHILADLGGQSGSPVALTVTVLDDTTSPPAYVPQGTRNPQTGVATFNLVLVSANTQFAATSFSFDSHTYQGGRVYTFPGTQTGTIGDGRSVQVNRVPAAEGLNIYDLVLAGRKFTVLVKVTGGQVTFGTLAGGGSPTWTAPNLFVGGLD